MTFGLSQFLPGRYKGWQCDGTTIEILAAGHHLMMCFRFGDEIVGFELRLDCLTFHSKAMAPDSGLFHILYNKDFVG